jgi:heme exporter protein B
VRVRPNTLQLIRAEWESDLRQKAVLAGILLQVFTAVLVCYLAVQVLALPAWNALFWILVVFGTIQGITKNFIAVPAGRWIYLYQLTNPRSLIISKITYNLLLMTVLTACTMALYSFFMGYFVQHTAWYLLTVWLTGAGISTVYTLVSAIAAKTRQAGLLAPVLSLPVIIPVLLAGLSSSRKCLEVNLPEAFYKDLAVVGILDLLLVYLSMVLFTFVWQE